MTNEINIASAEQHQEFQHKLAEATIAFLKALDVLTPSQAFEAVGRARSQRNGPGINDQREFQQKVADAIAFLKAADVLTPSQAAEAVRRGQAQGKVAH